MRFFSKYLSARDSISIHLSGKELFQGIQTKENQEISPLERVFASDTSVSTEEPLVYVQCIISFEAESPQILSERIAEFQRNIYVDFDTRRVCGIMSRMLSSFS